MVYRASAEQELVKTINNFGKHSWARRRCGEDILHSEGAETANKWASISTKSERVSPEHPLKRCPKTINQPQNFSNQGGKRHTQQQPSTTEKAAPKQTFYAQDRRRVDQCPEWLARQWSRKTRCRSNWIRSRHTGRWRLLREGRRRWGWRNHMPAVDVKYTAMIWKKSGCTYSWHVESLLSTR